MAIATRGRLEATISNLKAQQARSNAAPVVARPTAPSPARQTGPVALPQNWFAPRPTFQSAPVPAVRVDTMQNNLARMTMLLSEPVAPRELGLG